MAIELGWKRLLADHIRDFEPDTTLELDDTLAIDVNGDGVIQTIEIVDGFGDGVNYGPMDYWVDEEEAEAFCKFHMRALARKIPFLRAIVENEILPDNPINELILFESQVLSLARTDVDDLVDRVYEEIALMRNGVIGDSLELALGGSRSDWSTLQFMTWWINEQLEESGVVFEPGGSVLFLENFVSDVHRFDCDLSTFVFISIMHEMGLSASAVFAPNHVFARSIDDISGEERNIEVQNVTYHDEDFYIWNETERRHRRGDPRIDQSSIDAGTYLSSLDQAQLEGLYLFNIATALAKETSTIPVETSDVIEIYKESLRRFPDNPMALTGLGMAELELDMVEEASAHLASAIALDPNLSTAYESIATARIELAQMTEDTAQQELLYQQALEYLNSAIGLKPTPSAYTNRGYVYMALWRLDGERSNIRQAEDDFQRALRLDPDNAVANQNMEAVDSYRRTR